MNTLTRGLRDAQTRLNVSANNIANLTTPEFRAGRVNSEATPGGNEAVPVVEPYALAPSGDVPAEPAGEMINLILAKHAFAANAAGVKVDNDCWDSLIDAVG